METIEVKTKLKQKPEIRFASFKESWMSIKYGEIYSFYTTNSLSREKLNYEAGTVRNIHYGDIHTKFSTLFDINKENVPYINTEIDLSKIDKNCFCKEKDLVIADASEDYADIGKSIEIINLNNEKVIAGLHTFLARPDKHEMAKGFAGYLVKSFGFRKQVMKIAQGTKVLSLSTTRLAALTLIIPSFPEQQKIASFLSAVDEKIQQLTRRKELLEQYKKGVMRQIFSGKIRFKDDNRKAFPKWEDKRLGEISNISIGEFVIRTKQTPDGKYPVYNGGASWTGLYNDYNNEGNKIIISARGANAGFVNYEARRYWAGNSCYSVDIADKKLNIVFFIYYYLKFSQHLFTDYQQAANIPSVSKKDVQVFKIICPSTTEQQKIASFLSSLDTKIESVANQISQSQTFKKGLLQQMFV
jgi:type I restriction enzyme S subunit